MWICTSTRGDLTEASQDSQDNQDNPKVIEWPSMLPRIIFWDLWQQTNLAYGPSVQASVFFLICGSALSLICCKILLILKRQKASMFR
jgi:hypothetical protein